MILVRTKGGWWLRVLWHNFLIMVVHLTNMISIHFQELQPPVKMLIPIWKALCDASGIKEGSDTLEDVS